jgi:hypothetical protein
MHTDGLDPKPRSFDPLLGKSSRLRGTKGRDASALSSVMSKTPSIGKPGKFSVNRKSLQKLNGKPAIATESKQSKKDSKSKQRHKRTASNLRNSGQINIFNKNFEQSEEQAPKSRVSRYETYVGDEVID